MYIGIDPLVSGMWFTCGEEFSIRGGSGMVIETTSHLLEIACSVPYTVLPPPPFALGGPCEELGRLR